MLSSNRFPKQKSPFIPPSSLATARRSGAEWFLTLIAYKCQYCENPAKQNCNPQIFMVFCRSSSVIYSNSDAFFIPNIKTEKQIMAAANPKNMLDISPPPAPPLPAGPLRPGWCPPACRSGRESPASSRQNEPQSAPAWVRRLVCPSFSMDHFLCIP